MFEALRRMIMPIIIIVLFFFVAMIVLQWGLGFSSRQDFVAANVAGAVNGEEVSWQVYQAAYDNLYQQAASDTAEELSEARTKKIKADAWNQIMTDRLLTQQALKHNLVVSDDETYSYLKLSPPAELQQFPYFQTDGKFDYQKYINTMADPQAATFWNSILPNIRNDILKLKLQERIVQTAHVSESEIKERFVLGREKVKIGIVAVTYARFSRSPAIPSDEELREYYDNNTSNYLFDERAALNIAIIEKNPSSVDAGVIQHKLNAIIDSLKDGIDFGQMAQNHSEDLSNAQTGGDLGWFGKGQMVQAFEERAFSMKEGDISDPFESQFGWHIIKHHGYRDTQKRKRGTTEDETVKEAHVSHILIKATASRQTLDTYFSRLRELAELAKEKGLAEAAKEMQISLVESGAIFRGRPINPIGNDPVAGIFAFDEKLGAISKVLENNSAYYVVEVSDKIPAGPAKFEEVKDQVHQHLRKDIVVKECQDTAAAIYAEIEQGIDIKEAAKNHGAKYQTPKEFARGGLVFGFGKDQKLIGTAFGLSEPGQISPPVDYNQGTAIIQLMEGSALELTEYNSIRDSLRTEIMRSKQGELYGRWFENLVGSSEIINNTDRTAETDSTYL